VTRITLLVAIAEAAQSPDLSISSQIPPSLRDSKTLILCPPTLIDNWMDELLMWSPPGILGEYRKFDSALKTKDVRLDVIESWYANGGILIMSYEMFRQLVHNNATQKKAAPLNEEEHAQVCKHLLEGPNIVVADEAHKMKNANASITQAAIKLRSNSRIALTGSPLANNVEEYHTMIEWIAPNYLGPITEFRAKYVEPIQQGLWSESTSNERKRSLKMLGVLREDLSPKVHRADISVLRKDLKPKTEFVITVPLTDLQHKAYSIYVKSMLGNDHEVTKDGQVQLSTLWHWLAILSLLCNHPACFKAKLSERKDDAEKKGRGKSSAGLATPKASTSEDDEGPSDAPLWKVGVSEELVRQEMDLFKQFGAAVEDFYSSNKVKLLLQILDASKAVGDKVLIFSHSIQTLNFLEGLCRSTGRNYARLDGSTKMSSRQGLTKDFNTGNTELYLISTTAGGIGLNLPGANRVIIFDFKFNPVNEEQAVGRTYRIGQQKPVFVYRFVAGGTFEESIHNKAVFKVQLASRVVDKKNPVAWAKRRTGDFLFEPKIVKQQDLSSFKGMDPFVLDKLLNRQDQDSTIRAIVMTDTFERHDDEVLTAEELKEVLQLVSDEKLKRTNKPAWDAEVRKRALAARPQHSIHQPPQTGSIIPTFQAARNKGQHIHSSTSALEPPPILPGMLPASSLPPRSSNNLNPQSILNPIIPEMMPIAGVNTKIRDSTPPLDSSYRQKRSGSRSDPLAATSGSRRAVLGHINDAPNNSSDLRGLTSTNPAKSLTRGVTVNGRAAIRDKEPPKELSPEHSKKVPPGTLPAPDHKRSLSGDQRSPNAADMLLRVAIMQYSRSGNSFLFSDSKGSERLFDELAVSIRKEIERIDSMRLKERTEEIISLLSGNRQLADALVSGKLTAGAIVAMPTKQASNMTNGANGLGSLQDERNSPASLDRRRKLGRELTAAIQATLRTNRAGLANSQRYIEVATTDLFKVLAETSKDAEAFEAAADAALMEVTSYQTCLRLVTGVMKPRDFVKDLIAKSTKPHSSKMDGPSDSPKVGILTDSIQTQSDRSSDDHSTTSFLGSTFQRLFASSPEKH
jgi:superfamily II DNA or RNA helicase